MESTSRGLLLNQAKESAMKRCFRFGEEAPFAIQWTEWTGEENTRQVTQLGEGWICSLDPYVTDFGPTLAHHPLSDLDLSSHVEVTASEFEKVWETAVRFLEGQRADRL
jgi:hypothetical protein